MYPGVSLPLNAKKWALKDEARIVHIGHAKSWTPEKLGTNECLHQYHEYSVPVSKILRAIEATEANFQPIGTFSGGTRSVVDPSRKTLRDLFSATPPSRTQYQLLRTNPNGPRMVHSYQWLDGQRSELGGRRTCARRWSGQSCHALSASSVSGDRIVWADTEGKIFMERPAATLCPSHQMGRVDRSKSSSSSQTHNSTHFRRERRELGPLADTVDTRKRTRCRKSTTAMEKKDGAFVGFIDSDFDSDQEALPDLPYLHIPYPGATFDNEIVEKSLLLDEEHLLVFGNNTLNLRKGEKEDVLVFTF